MENTLLPELSRIVSLIKLEKNIHPYTIEATDLELEKLISRLAVKEIKNLKISVEVKWLQSHAIDFDIKGKIVADVVQYCVLTHKPVPEHINEDFNFRVIHPSREIDFQEELDAFEDIEFSSDGEIDIGEIATQYLILGMNPYPRAEEE
jgi:uncharacterized metal-binding protein YceD (DUF177 family)